MDLLWTKQTSLPHVSQVHKHTRRNLKASSAMILNTFTLFYECPSLRYRSEFTEVNSTEVSKTPGIWSPWPSFYGVII